MPKGTSRNRLSTFFACGGIFVLLFIVVLFLVAFIKNSVIKKQIKGVQAETDCLPAYVAYGTVFWDGDEIDVYSLISQKSRSALNEIYCVYNNNVYFSYTQIIDSAKIWTIASVDFSNSILETHCQLTEVTSYYSLTNETSSYQQKNGYYKDGKIILNDKERVLVYDIVSQENEIFSFEKFAFPEAKKVGETIDPYTINLFSENGNRVYSFGSMAQASSEIAKIYKLKSTKTWDPKVSCTEYFFTDNSVQFVGGNIYAVGQIFNFSGEAYAVILAYDSSEEKWEYVSSAFARDTISSIRCYLIPTHK